MQINVSGSDAPCFKKMLHNIELIMNFKRGSLLVFLDRFH